MNFRQCVLHKLQLFKFGWSFQFKALIFWKHLECSLLTNILGIFFWISSFRGERSTFFSWNPLTSHQLLLFSAIECCAVLWLLTSMEFSRKVLSEVDNLMRKIKDKLQHITLPFHRSTHPRHRHTYIYRIRHPDFVFVVLSHCDAASSTSLYL